jgi:AraC-like DNA-binding protein
MRHDPKRPNLKRLTLVERHVRQQWCDVLTVLFDQAYLRGWSLPEFAAKAGISTSTVYRYYHEQFLWVRGDCVGKLMHSLGINWAHLVEGGVVKKEVAA